MSVIIDVAIHCEWEDAAMREVNKRLSEDDERQQQFRRLDSDQAGGTKVFCDEIWAGAFNHLLPETIRNAICEAQWRVPEHIIVVESSGDYEIDLRARTVTELRAELALR